MAARHLLYFTAEDHYLYTRGARQARARGQVLRRRPRRERVPRVPARAARRAVRRARRPGRRGLPRGAGALAARQRPRGGGAAPPRPALPRHAPRRSAVARPGADAAAPQRAAAAHLVHQYAAVRALARRARGSGGARSPACIPCRCSRPRSRRALARAARARWWSPPTAPACASASSRAASCASRAWSAPSRWCRRRWQPSCAPKRCASPST